MDKVSIRFYKDHEVRAVWSEEDNKWFFSVLDVIGAINEQPDYAKTRNYWKYLKTKLRKEGNELVSATNQLKLRAADGKRYNTDMMDAEGITALAKAIPNQKATAFLDWFVYSDSSIDGQSLPVWWSLRFCRSDSHKNHLEGWHTILPCRVFDEESEYYRGDA